MSRSDCAICASQHGVGPLAGPVVCQDDLVLLKHVIEGPATFLGHLVLESRRHAVHLDGLSDAEAEAVARLRLRAAAALRGEPDVAFVHAAVIGQSHEHFHEHLYVRYADTPAEYGWHAADSWPAAPHGDSAAVEELCARLRARMAAAHPPPGR